MNTDLNMITDLMWDFIPLLPHGSGLDSDYDVYQLDNKICFEIGYHHMSALGFYSGWSNVTISYEYKILNPTSIKIFNPEIEIENDSVDWDCLISNMDDDFTRDYELNPATESEITDFKESEYDSLLDYFYDTFPSELTV